MTGDLQKYLDDTVQKQKDLNKTTLKLYQTQLNPIFSIIHWIPSNGTPESTRFRRLQCWRKIWLSF